MEIAQSYCPEIQVDGYTVHSDFRVTQSKPGKINFSTHDKLLFYSLRQFIDDHFTKEHSLKSLSRQFATNEFKLKAGFKMLFRTTIFRYIHLLRMNYAMQLLQSGKRINEVSRVIGYKNSNHFSVAFKKHFGVVPSVVR